MRKYFSIKTTSDFPSVGNVFPQASSYYTGEVLIKSYNSDQKDWDAYESMKNIDRMPVDPGVCWKFVLEKKAKFTDVMSSTSVLCKGLLICERLYVFFSKFNMTGVDFFPCTVQSKHETRSYYYLYPRQPLVDKFIDIEKTTFILLDLSDNDFRMEYKAKNRQHYLERMKNAATLGRYLTTKDGLYFKDFMPDADIIELERFGRLFVSEQLKNELLSKDFTGFDIGSDINIYQS